MSRRSQLCLPKAKGSSFNGNGQMLDAETSPFPRYAGPHGGNLAFALATRGYDVTRRTECDFIVAGAII
jgi:hypothetical protein